jgi:transposase
LAELAPGGIDKKLNVSDAESFMAKLCPETPSQQMRFDLALELLDDVRRLDAQLKESHRRIRVAIKASGTSLTSLYGVGPVIAATLIGYSGEITCRPSRNSLALPSTARHRSSFLREDGPCTGCLLGAAASSTTLCT